MIVTSKTSVIKFPKTLDELAVETLLASASDGETLNYYNVGEHIIKDSIHVTPEMREALENLEVHTANNNIHFDEDASTEQIELTKKTVKDHISDTVAHTSSEDKEAISKLIRIFEFEGEQLKSLDVAKTEIGKAIIDNAEICEATIGSLNTNIITAESAKFNTATLIREVKTESDKAIIEVSKDEQSDEIVSITANEITTDTIDVKSTIITSDIKVDDGEGHTITFKGFEEKIDEVDEKVDEINANIEDIDIRFEKVDSSIKEINSALALKDSAIHNEIDYEVIAANLINGAMRVIDLETVSEAESKEVELKKLLNAIKSNFSSRQGLVGNSTVLIYNGTLNIDLTGLDTDIVVDIVKTPVIKVGTTDAKNIIKLNIAYYIQDCENGKAIFYVSFDETSN